MQRSLPASSDEIQASVTGLRLTSKDTLGINYSMRRGSSISAATFPGLDTTRSNFGQNIGISGNHSFKSRLFANWRVSLNRTRDGIHKCIFLHAGCGGGSRDYRRFEGSDQLGAAHNQFFQLWKCCVGKSIPRAGTRPLRFQAGSTKWRASIPSAQALTPTGLSGTPRPTATGAAHSHLRAMPRFC